MLRADRIIVELADGDLHLPGLESDWAGLAAHVTAEKSNLVLLPEMPFVTFSAGRQ